MMSLCPLISFHLPQRLLQPGAAFFHLRLPSFICCRLPAVASALIYRWFAAAGVVLNRGDWFHIIVFISIDKAALLRTGAEKRTVDGDASPSEADLVGLWLFHATGSHKTVPVFPQRVPVALICHSSR